METYSALLPDTQSIAQLVGSACGRRAFTGAEGDMLEWALAQIALEGSGPVMEVVRSYHTSLLAGSDWHGAVAAALLQTPRQWGAEIQAAMSSFEEIRRQYRESDVAVYQFADGVILDHAMHVPPVGGFIPLSAPEDPRPKRLFDLAHQQDISGETIELVKVLQDRFPHVLKKSFKVSFPGALAALFCDLDIEIERIPRLLTVASLVAILFKPVRTL